MTERAPTLQEMLRAVLDHRIAGVHVCMPGVVQSYDPTKQTATIQPAIKNVIVCGDGEIQIDFPVINDVPVCFPRAGRWFLHFPLSAGDSVVLVFAERSLDQWRQLGGINVDPQDLRKHDLSDAIAIPGSVYPDGQEIAPAADHLSLGDASGSTIHVNLDGTIAVGSVAPIDRAATSTKVNTELQAIKSLLQALALDVTALYVLLGIPSPWATVALPAYLATGAPHDVGSAKVKIDP